MQKMSVSKLHYSLLLVVLVLLAGVAGFFWYQYILLTTELDEQRNARGQTETVLEEREQTIASLEEELAQTKEELANLEEDYEAEREKNEEFEDQIRDISGTVSNLDKLSKTDEELLQKYSKVYFLNENYVPADLDKIDKKYVLDGKGDQYFHGDAMEFLEDLLDEAQDDDIDLFITSAYRSFDEQTQLKGQYTQTYGEGANTFSADQGYSEHQLGTTLDLTTPKVGGPYTSFAQTEAYEWLQTNAHRFGFTLSYPENNQFYVFEPWHWRFVGVDLARDLERDGDSFYDLPQRDIDEYLIKIFD